MVDINEKAFGQLINEDIGWLKESTKDCLERQHIIVVLENALRQYCLAH